MADAWRCLHEHPHGYGRRPRKLASFAAILDLWRCLGGDRIGWRDLALPPLEAARGHAGGIAGAVIAMAVYGARLAARIATLIQLIFDESWLREASRRSAWPSLALLFLQRAGISCRLT